MITTRIRCIKTTATSGAKLVWLLNWSTAYQKKYHNPFKLSILLAYTNLSYNTIEGFASIF